MENTENTGGKRREIEKETWREFHHDAEADRRVDECEAVADAEAVGVQVQLLHEVLFVGRATFQVGGDDLDRHHTTRRCT